MSSLPGIMKSACLALLLLSPAFAADGFTTSAGEDKVRVELDGKLFTEYRTDSRVPYCYPLMSASGACLTRHWPMDKSHEGEERDHPHHRSFWLSHGAVNGHDFWAWTTKKSDPKIEHKGVRELKDGSFTVDLAWTAGGKTHLAEERTYTFTKVDADTGRISDGVTSVDVDITDGTIGADGTLGGYAGGIPRKQWLLDHERRHWGAGGDVRLFD